MNRFLAVFILLSATLFAMVQSGIGGGGQSNVSGGGAGSASGGGNMPGVFNLINYGGVDDDSTDNCANGSVTAFTAAVNAYSGPGQPVAIIPSGASNKAYKLATAACNFTFTIPVTVHLWGNLDCAQPAVTANCIQFGVTKSNGTTGYANAQIFKYMIDGGGTMTGGVNLTNAGIEIEPTIVNVLITELNFKNFGAFGATLGQCTNYAILFDYAVAEGTVENNHWQVTDSNNGRCAFGNPNGSTTGSNTILFLSNTLGGQSATNTSGCSSQGIVDGGSLGQNMNNNIYAFAVPTRLQGVGHRMQGNQIDNAGCTTGAGGNAAIQFGAASSSTAVGPLTIMGNIAQVTTLTTHSNPLFARATDSTATIFGVTLIGNVSNGAGGANYGQLMAPGQQCTDDTTGLTGTICYQYGNVNMGGLVTCGATASGWQFEIIVAGCSSSAQTANLGNTLLFTPAVGITKAVIVSCQVLITTAATTSSTLPQCVISYTDFFTNTAQSITVTPVLGAGATVGCNGTAITDPIVGTSCQGTTGVIVPKANTAVNYSTTGYASVGGTAMQYQAFVRATVH